ncbi:MAG: hypothetical protein KJP12_07025, partial [Acidimicrobiia bacterium]|nr:hypothetical protein [Acidimicrobiia bacterium]
MAKLLRLIGVLAMAVLVASSSALPAPSTGAIGNAFRPTRRIIQIAPALPVIKDQAVQETGVIQMSATIGHPRYNSSDEPESSPASDVIEQRVYSGETDRSADEVGSALETVLLMQGLEVDQQLSS